MAIMGRIFRLLLPLMFFGVQTSSAVSMKTMESGLFSRLFSSVDVGIDLGTAFTRVYIQGRGIVLEEPTVAVMDPSSGRVKAVGSQAFGVAKQEGLELVRPLQHGVIADFDAAQGLLEMVLTRVAGRNLFFKPRVMVCVPTGVTGVERRAVVEAALQAGAARTYLLEAPMAAALGAGMPVFRPLGQLVVNIGGDTTSAAVISMGHIIEASSLRMGGKAFTEALLRYLNKTMNVQLEPALAAGALSPTAMNYEDVEFAVVDDRLDDFMQMVYEILKPIRGELPRIEEFCRWMEGDRPDPKRHPFLWEGRQLILTFAKVDANAFIAMARAELALYAEGLGGFYSLFMNMAAERDPERFAGFFPAVPRDKKLKCVFVCGHPRIRFARTVPPRNISVHWS